MLFPKDKPISLINGIKRIYLDNNATTSLDPRVLQAMLSDLNGPPSNPSSVHWFGQQARGRLLSARESAASFFQANQDEITFTSGGTESVNLMLHHLPPLGHVITTSIEHSAMYKTLKHLGTNGLNVSYLPVGRWGAPLAEQIDNAIRPNTSAIALSASNAETGIKIDIPSIAMIAEKKGIPLLLDCVSYIGKESLLVHRAISSIAISAHKFHGPKGVGLLFHRSSMKIAPLLTGGGQEYQLRAGTENLAGILGLAEALKIISENQPAITDHLYNLRVYFENELKQALSDIMINGEGPRISNTSNIAFLGVDGETLLLHLDLAGIAVSHGSACSSGALEPSRVLIHMGIDKKIVNSSLRFSFGRTNTREEIDYALDVIVKLVNKLKT